MHEYTDAQMANVFNYLNNDYLVVNVYYHVNFNDAISVDSFSYFSIYAFSILASLESLDFFTDPNYYYIFCHLALFLTTV